MSSAMSLSSEHQLQHLASVLVGEGVIFQMRAI